MGRILAALVLLAAVACGDDDPAIEGPEGDEGTVEVPEGDVGPITLTSPAFSEGDPIPVRHTCDGEDLSPPLEWSGVPEEAERLTLTLADPDAPDGTFVHWVVTGIDPGTTGVEEGATPEGGTEGPTSFGETGYGGPCPPEGDEPHRYVFSLVAEDGAGNPLGSGTLTGRYGR